MDRTAGLFFDNGDQCVQLPEGVRFPGSEVLIREDPETGDLILSPMAPESSD